jgi:hypothetical protein
MAEQQEVEGVEIEQAPVGADEHWAKLLEGDGGDTAPDEEVDPSVDPDVEETPAVTTQRKKWADLEKPTVAQLAAKERIAKRMESLAGLGEQRKLADELAAERARLADLERSQAAADAKFRQLFEDGKIDEALKVKGVSVSLGDMSRKLLATKTGSIGGKDPRVDALEQQIQGFLSAQQRQQAEAQRLEQQRQAQLAAQEEASALADEIAALPYEGAEALRELPGFVDSVYGDLVASRGSADTEALVRQHRSNYQALLDQLYQAALAGALEMPTAKSKGAANGAAKPRAAVPPSGTGKAPRKALPDRLLHNTPERWEAILEGKI